MRILFQSCGSFHFHLLLSILRACCDVQTEVTYLGQLRHPNLVKLIGYCSEGDNRLLVYEFMPKGSLDNHLFRSMYASAMMYCLKGTNIHESLVISFSINAF